MQIIVRGTNVTVTPDMRQRAEKKVSRLARLVRDTAKLEVVEHAEREFRIVEVVLHDDGLTLRAKDRTTDVYASIDAAVEKIERQLKKMRAKKRVARHKGAAEVRQPAEGESASPEEEAEETFNPLPRRSLFSKPMTEEEAVLQVNFSGEEIFIFHNLSTQQFNVLHRLSDGSLELIEPEAG